VYAVFNGFLEAQYQPTNSTGVDLVMRSVSSLIRRQGIGDLYRIYLGALRDGLEFRLAYIPRNFTRRSDELFDPEYMTALFDLGYELARGGYRWAEAPPGFVPETHQPVDAPTRRPPADSSAPAGTEPSQEAEPLEGRYPPPRRASPP
jgi:hypothetical protein